MIDPILRNKRYDPVEVVRGSVHGVDEFFLGAVREDARSWKKSLGALPFSKTMGGKKGEKKGVGNEFCLRPSRIGRHFWDDQGVVVIARKITEEVITSKPGGRRKYREEGRGPGKGERVT